jgi:aconitate hydratase
MPENPNSFDARDTLTVGGAEHTIFRLDALQSKYDVARLPFSLKVLLENLLRTEGNGSVQAADVEKLARWDAKAEPSEEIAFTPARVVMQDFTGVPAVVDLAAMRDAMADLGGDPAQINPLVPAELVIDHSVQVDVFGTRDAFVRNAEREFERNQERYAFLRWGQGAFDDFSVVPPDTGIVHQVNLEYLARVVFVERQDRRGLPRHARRDRLAHDDDQRPRRARLGRGRDRGRGRRCSASRCRCSSRRCSASSSTASCPRARRRPTSSSPVTELLRKKGVVGRFVEFYGPGVSRCRSPTARRSAT